MADKSGKKVRIEDEMMVDVGDIGNVIQMLLASPVRRDC